MRIYVFFLFFILLSNVQSQETYRQLTTTALKTMWHAKDDQDRRTALELYEQAFQLYPDSIDILGLYKASVLAGELRALDTAFTYLEKLSVKLKQKTAGWTTLAGNYYTSEYKNLLDDPRWTVLHNEAKRDKENFYTSLKTQQEEFFSRETIFPFDGLSPAELYGKLRDLNIYREKARRNYSITFAINDTTQTAYFVRLPENYNPEKAYPLLFFLHGAVRNNALVDYITEDVLGNWNRYYTRYAASNDVILVFPKGSKQYNWMVPDDGFSLVPQILKALKQALNVNDDKIFVSGHSNGATGAFSYWMKAPTMFAGFFGFNTYPKVFTGGTFVRNAKSRFFKNFSTDQDYYYPPWANDSMQTLMNELGADYQDQRFNGYPHWFPKFDASEPAYELLFDQLMAQERNPFPSSIEWEFDDLQYASIDWIRATAIDTLMEKADWQETTNFNIKSWLAYDDQDELITETVDKRAFDFPRRSAALKARYEANVFHVITSRVIKFRLFISPEMVDLNKKVEVYVNGQLKFRAKVKIDPKFLIENFSKQWDRSQIWVNYLELEP